jgi:hypothetical protein
MKALALRQFVKEVYAPGLHAAYAAAWFLALEGTLVSVEGDGLAWRFDGGVVVGVLTLFLVLFFLRVVDEWKDEGYDRVHNPSRPLVRGTVTQRDLFAYLAGTAAVVLGLNALLSWKLVLIAALDMAWGVFLVRLERMSARVRDGMFANLLVTYPVNVALSVYTYAFFLERYGVAPSPRGVLVLAGFALAFLNYEVSRKTAWPSVAVEGERLYSRVIGGERAIALAFSCAVGASALLFAALVGRGAGPLAFVVLGAPLVPATLALVRFLRERTRRLKLAPLGIQFLLLFYAGLCVRAFVTNPLALALGSTP